MAGMPDKTQRRLKGPLAVLLLFVVVVSTGLAIWALLAAARG